MNISWEMVYGCLKKIKGARCHGSDELVFEKRLKPFVMNANGQIDNLKVEYNDPCKHASKLQGFPVTSGRNTVGYFEESKF